jgi:microcystin-dependent protein
MSDPFIAEIKAVSFNYAPRGWALCNGQLLPINQNQALFSILGTTYGGDGRTTFALPDLRGRVPVHIGGEIPLGVKTGEENHTITPAEMPQHTHRVHASGQHASLDDPSGAVWAAATNPLYAGGANAVMHPSSVTTVGGSQPHLNLQPYLVINFIIALVGIYPPRN